MASKPSLRWRLGDDRVWYLDIVGGHRERTDIGFVSEYMGTGKYLAMYSQPCLRWYMAVRRGTIRECAMKLADIGRDEIRDLEPKED
jgi:hypothetical protein